MSSPTQLAAGASVPTRTASSVGPSSTKMHHGGADKNWRGKYLRALNICQPEVDFPRDKFGDGAGRKPKSRSDVDVGSRSYGSSSEKHDHLASWSRRDGSVQKRSTPRAAARGATAGVGFRTGAPGMNSYGFTLKPALSRGRRCHTDPFTMEEHVSAPIQIPSAHTNGENPASKVHRADNRMFADRRPDRRREGSGDAAANDHTTRLLSWEEPVAMLAAANAVAAGLPVDQNNRMFGINDSGSPADDTLEDFDDSDDSDDDDDDDNCGDIFEMEEIDSDGSTGSSSSSSARPSKKSTTHKGRRRRTVSASVISSSRSRLPGQDEMKELPASFVPPHQMVERDCFSLGLQNEFKRRPVRI